jgi:hypothetical protein
MIRRLWQTSPELVGTAALMAPVLAASVIGLAVDSTMISDAPAWLKPAKFAVSFIIYTLTLAWVFTFIPDWSRTRRLVGWGTALTMVLEMSIIAGQAWRGTASHFNVGTTIDAILFGIMGLAIVTQTFATVAVAVALWRQRFADRALGWAVRLGTLLTIAGALTGGLMTGPTADQLAAARAGARMTVAGAHTVGAPDGGPGLPGTGWSTEHGDVRVPHFVGLHALQALAIVALLLGRAGLREKVRERLVLVAAASYAGLFGILLVQALRGVPLFAPDAATLAQLTTWAIVTTAAASMTWFTNVRQPRAITTI